MEQLSGLDNLFLHVENRSENVCQHLAAFGIYDSHSAPGGALRFRDLLAHFEQVLAGNPVFRRRLVGVPHQLDRPWWVVDPDVDIEFHVRHIALPQPGDWRQLMIQIARLHSRALDLSKPPWEVYVIEGLDNIAHLPRGCFALFFKVHHAALDSIGAVQVIRDIHAPTAAAHDAFAPAGDEVADREPGALALYAGVLRNSLARTAGSAWLSGRLFGRLAGMGAHDLRARLAGRAAPRRLPDFVRAVHSRFNARVTPNRVVEVIDLPLAQFAPIRAACPQASASDILLTCIGGALRNYLKARGELPEASLRALLSLNLGASGVLSSRNSRLPASLFSDLRDPLARLAAIQAETQRLHDGPWAGLGKELLPALLGELPGALACQINRQLLLAQVNCLFTSVRGPSAPMSLSGARALQFCPLSLLSENVGLGISSFSYAGQMSVSLVACRAILPDPATLAQCLRESFEELRRAAQRRIERPARRGGKRGDAAVSGAAAPASAAQPARRRSASRKPATHPAATPSPASAS